MIAPHLVQFLSVLIFNTMYDYQSSGQAAWSQPGTDTPVSRRASIRRLIEINVEKGGPLPQTRYLGTGRIAS